MALHVVVLHYVFIVCWWACTQRKKPNGSKASTQTINLDHVALKHCLNMAIKRGLLQADPASRVEIPNPQNERDRVLTGEEWGRLHQAAKPHLRPVLLTASGSGRLCP